MSYIPRVTQLDAGHLDDQVTEVFKLLVFEATKYFEPGLLQPILPELELILRSWVFKYSVYNKKCTFGQQMLSLNYSEDHFTKSKLYWYYFNTVGLKYLKERTTYSFTSNIKVQNWLNRLEMIHSICDILNFLRFIRTGKYPTLTDFILGLRMNADKITREDLTDFAWTRELLWHNLIELIGTAISLMNIFGLRNRISGMLKYVWGKKQATGAIVLTAPKMTVNTLCAVCGDHPTLPHVMGCSHIFCYYCLAANKTADKDFTCPKCHYNGAQVTKCLNVPIKIRITFIYIFNWYCFVNYWGSGDKL